jgi:hypothetical protein
LVKKGWKQLSIHDSLWEKMRKRVERENKEKEDWEKKLSCNKYAELSIAAQLERDGEINRDIRMRPEQIDMVAIG